MKQNLTFDRRFFLRGAVGTVAAAGLAACGSGSGGASAGSQLSDSTLRQLLPAYVPYPELVRPDLPGNALGLVNAYFSYPAQPKKVTSGVPGDGSNVSAYVLTTYPTVPGLPSNHYWQELNRRLGVNLQVTQVSTADYPLKFQTLIASSDMPDFMQFKFVPTDMPELLAAKFTNLAPYLSGDKIKKYPFLANIPSYFWSTAVIYDGGIYGIPIPAYKMCDYMFQRNDILAAKGLDGQVSSWQDFVALCKEVNDPAHNQWAISHCVQETPSSTSLGVLAFAQTSLGVPNNWSEQGGKFTSYYEDERTKQAIDAVRQLVRAGYVHPNGFTGVTTDFVRSFANGQAVMSYVGLTSLPNFYVQDTIGPKMQVGGTGPIKFDSSSKPNAWQRQPSFSFTGIKKTSDAKRVDMLLSLANWMAAPFGSEEYRFIFYGSEGVDFTVNAQRQPVQTTRGIAETSGFGVQYIAATPRVLYVPRLAGPIKAQYGLEKAMMPSSVADPTLGLYSPTYASTWNNLDTNMLDAIRAILKGDQPLSSWDDAVSTFKSQGGTAIATDYEKALQQRGK